MGEDDKTNIKHTPPKFNMEPENDGFQKESPLPKGLIFRFHVKLPGCTFKQHNTSGHRARLWRFPEIRGGGCGGGAADPWVSRNREVGKSMGLKDHVIRFSHI